jgi:gluconate kinase
MVLPAHSLAITQPLDIAVCGPLKRKYGQLLDARASNFTTTYLTKSEFATYVARAREAAGTKKNIKSGWRAAGLYPFVPS